MLGRVKLGHTLLTGDQGSFNQTTAWNLNQTLVTVVRDTCTTTVPPAPNIVVTVMGPRVQAYVLGQAKFTRAYVYGLKERYGPTIFLP